MTTLTAPRINPTDLQALLRLPPYGAEDIQGGFFTEGDIVPRVTATADNIDLNRIWLEMQSALGEWNAHRSAIVDLLSYWHTSTADAVPQALVESMYERASEFGEPESMGPPSEYLLLGYTMVDWDRAARFTWRFLRDADARQVRAVLDEAMRGDNTTVTRTILNRLFSPAAETNDSGNICYGLWNGTDGMKPPPVLGKTFTADHTHYLWSGNGTVDSGDLELSIRHVREHGYGLVDGAEELVCLVHPTESEIIQSFRANVENENTQTAKWDFIQAVNQPAFIIAEGGQLVGSQPPGTVFNLPTVGKYGPLWIVESNFVPEHYMAVVATAGPGAASNAIGVRQHPNRVYQGLRQIPGNANGYPLQDSFYSRTFGVGTRHRGAAVVTQITASSAYTAPTIISV
ncbi:hypothetical protein [Mycobacterium sp. 1423905.2]|uniref:hypothetical protein n=1 Tax=Mycobacterium sp. 1423905.2 TaxID=1856859 RepID=UPI0007FBA141|nr:hypothetical protein [Mycobacterium sp. 1423905.2]OBJ61283.1 hypothetical protein A9W95_09665 [Mycobacterium sp. 1423905.2]